MVVDGRQATADGNRFVMWQAIWGKITFYLNFYQDFIIQQWNNMTPMKYGSLLICIAIFGFLLMKSGTRRV